MVKINDLNRDFTVLKPLLKKSSKLITMELVRKSKKLSDELVKKKGDAKLLRKKRRNDIEIEHIKGINYIQLLQSALTTTTDFQKIINSETATPETRSEARILIHKCVKDKIVELQKKVNVEEESEKLQSMFEKLLANKKLKDKINKRNVIIKEEKLERQSKKERREKKVEAMKDDEESQDDNSIDDRSATKSKTSKTKQREAPTTKSNIVKEEIEQPVAKAVDSFFFTSTGRHYLATATEPEPSQSLQNDKLNAAEYDVEEDPNVVKPRRFKDNSHKKLINFKEMDEDNDKAIKKAKSKKNKANPNELHPSWAAKKKSKPTITEFQGKKIVFNESESAGMQQDMEQPDAELHPSWSAKKKNKPIVKKFEGKRIVFGDTQTADDSKKESAPSNEVLHPSWAAKKNSKPIIQKFEGKKTVFED